MLEHRLTSRQKGQNERPSFLFWFLLTIVFGGLLGSLALLPKHAIVDTASPPPIITYQGKVLQNSQSVTTTQSMGFLLYDAETGGNLIYTAAGTLAATSTVSITPTSGIFSVNLGASGTNALPTSTFATYHTLFLEVHVGGTTLSPRKRITAVPYAFNSQYLMGIAATSTSGTEYIPHSDAFGNFLFSGTPRSGIGGGVVYINPTSSLADATLLGLAVGGSERLRIDEDGDVFSQGSVFASGTLYIGSVSSTGSIGAFGSLFTSSSLFVQSSIRVNQTGGTFDLGRFYVDGSGNVAASGTIQFTGLSNCNTIDTDTNGILSCGTDDSAQFDGRISRGNIFQVTNGSTTSTLSANEFAVATSSANRLGLFYIDQSGNVFASGSLNVDSATLYVASTTNKVGVGTSTPYALLSVEHTAGQAGFAVGSSTATNFIVDASGRVGIGVTAPSNKLHVRGSGSGFTSRTSLILENNASGDNIIAALEITAEDLPEIRFDNFLGNTQAIIGHNVASGYFYIDNGANGDDLVVNSSGVGVGTTTPYGLLSVNHTAGNVAFAIGSSTKTNFIVDANGWVGIGTESPTAGVEIVGNPVPLAGGYSGGASVLRLRDADSTTTTASAYIAFGATNTSTPELFARTGFVGDGSHTEQSIDLWGYENSYLRLGTHNLERVRITSSTGFVGINSTTPWAQLSVSSTSAQPSFAISSSTDTLFLVDRFGRVGIGTDSPAAALHIGSGGFISRASSTIASSLNVSGNLNASSTLYVGGNILPGTNGGSDLGSFSERFNLINANQVFAGTQTQLYNGGLDVETSFILQTEAGDNNLEIRTTNFDNAIYIDNLPGRVGIGTSTPYALLSVEHTAGVPGFVVGSSTATNFIVNASGYVGIGTPSPSFPLHINEARDANLFGYLNSRGGNGKISGILFGTNTSGGSNTGASLGHDGTNDIFFVDRGTGGGTTNQFDLVVKSSTGRVGVGVTTTPWATLSVSSTPGFANSIVVGNTGRVDFMVDSNGQVGINSSSPQYGLSVSSSVYITGTTTIADATTIKGRIIRPRAIGSIGAVGGVTISNPSQMFAVGNYLYATAYVADAVVVIDVTDPSTPVGVGSISNATGVPLNGAGTIYVQGNYAYVGANVDNALTILDVSNPASPSFVGTLADGGGSAPYLSNLTQVFVSGNYAYIAAYGDNAVEIVDISDPHSPRHAGSYVDATNLNGVYALFVSGQYLYTVSAVGNRLAVFDIADPVNPVLRGVLADGGASPPYLSNGNTVFVYGKYAYVAANDDNAIEIVDISNPRSPRHAAAVTSGGNVLLGGPRTVMVSGNYAFVSAEDSNALTILDVTSSTNPKHVVSVPDGGVATSPHLSGALGIFPHGNYVYVGAASDNRIQMFDVTGLNTANAEIGIARIGELQVYNPSFFMTNLHVRGGLSAGNGLQLMGDLSLSAPTSSATMLNATSTVRFSNRALFVASSTNGYNFIFDTANTLASSTSNVIFSVRNNGTRMFSISSNGDAKIDGSIFASSTIIGTPGNPGDVAERVDISPGDQVEAGDVVIIDPDRNDSYRRSQRAYDPRVAGVISTNPNIVVGSGKTTSTADLALAGRVPLKVSTENGSLVRGDLLVASSLPGVAMKYDPNTTATQGPVAVIGMALEEYTGTTVGKIMVLVKSGWVYPGLTSAESGNAPGSLVQGNMVGNVDSIASLEVRDVTFAGNIVVRGHASFAADTVGQARILAAETRVRVTFEREYAYQPIVTVTPRGEATTQTGFYYTVTEESTTGFTITIDRALADDMNFNWHAFGGVGSKIYVSDGSTEDVRVIVSSSLEESVAPDTSGFDENVSSDTETDETGNAATTTEAIAENTTEDTSEETEAGDDDEEGEEAVVENTPEEPEPEEDTEEDGTDDASSLIQTAL